MERKRLGNEYRTTLLCVDEYGPQTCSGRLYNPFLPQAIAIGNLNHLVLAMDRMLDEMKLPQSFTARREFALLADRPRETFVPGEARGKRATFAIRVLFRQNATWQGNLTWLEGNRTEDFASVLELLAFLHETISNQENEP